MADRRYSDKEMATIFRAATEGPAKAPIGTCELRRASRSPICKPSAVEVGISPDAVAQAAQALDIRQGAASRTFLDFRSAWRAR